MIAAHYCGLMFPMKQRSIPENVEKKGGRERIESQEKNDIYLVLDNIRSMYNVGAIFRSAEGAKVKKIFLCGITATPPREQIFKTSLGAVEWVDWQYYKNTEDAINHLKKSGVRIIALEQTDVSIDYKKAQYDPPLAIVVGHELKGVSPQALELSDLSVEIPMYGKSNSLNVATATGIVLFEALSQTKK